MAVNNIQSSQAQTLEQWVKAKRGTRKQPMIARLRKASQAALQIFDDLFLYDTHSSRTMERVTVAIILGIASIITVVQLGIEKGWW